MDRRGNRHCSRCEHLCGQRDVPRPAASGASAASRTLILHRGTPRRLARSAFAPVGLANVDRWFPLPAALRGTTRRCRPDRVQGTLRWCTGLGLDQRDLLWRDDPGRADRDARPPSPSLSDRGGTRAGWRARSISRGPPSPAAGGARRVSHRRGRNWDLCDHLDDGPPARHRCRQDFPCQRLGLPRLIRRNADRSCGDGARRRADRQQGDAHDHGRRCRRDSVVRARVPRHPCDWGETGAPTGPHQRLGC